MISDDERSEAAQSLKHYAHDQLQGGLLNTLKLATGVDGTWRKVLLRLADLIDPSGGQNEPDVSVDRYRGTETGRPDIGGQCPESRHEMSGIDREALLAVSEEMLSVSIGINSSDNIRPLEAAYILQGYARRIREACGVTAYGEEA